MPRRDAVDTRVMEMVRTGKPTAGDAGIIKTPDDVGGYPTYAFKPEEVPADTDTDGMPDEWERKHALAADNPADAAADADKDGYTNIEEHLNGTDPTQAIDYANLDNNVDTISG